MIRWEIRVTLHRVLSLVENPSDSNYTNNDNVKLMFVVYQGKIWGKQHELL